MDPMLQRLFPLPAAEVPLEGLYLAQDLRAAAVHSARPLVYANFITSLDGRIAIPHPSGEGLTVPEQIANPRDWRLFQELGVQADLLISTGRYLRDYAEGRAQEILEVYAQPQFKDLGEWRTARGLAPYPALAVISNRLEFVIPEVLAQGARKLLVVTSASANRQRIQALQQKNVEVIIAGETSVDGERLIDQLGERGYRTIYSAAGPRVLHLLAASRVLDRLYLTVATRLLAGDPFSSIAQGPLLAPPLDFSLQQLVFDPHADVGGGQLFMVYHRSD